MTTPTTFKLYAVQESTEVYAAANAEDARKHVEELMGEVIPEDEVWECDGAQVVRIEIAEEPELISKLGIQMPDVFPVWVMYEHGRPLFATMNHEANNHNPRIYPLGRKFYATPTHIILTCKEVAEAQVALGVELPFMVSSGYS